MDIIEAGIISETYECSVEMETYECSVETAILESTGVTYVHNQDAEAAIWIIDHPLNRKPNVTIVDSGDNEWHGGKRYITNNQVIIEFEFAMNGKAYLS